MSSITINKPIEGNKKNNTLTNKKTGMTAMYGYAGNDTYIVNNLSKSLTGIFDKSGKDNLHIKNLNGSNLVFMFDIATSDDKKAEDELDIIQKNKFDSVINQLNTYGKTKDKYDMPKGGLIGIDDYLGNTNNIQADGKYGSNFGNGYIEKIYTTNSTGTEYVLNVKSYIKKLTPILSDFYEKNKTLIKQEDEATIKQLVNLYKNTPINMKVKGSKKADKIFGGNGKDKIYANSGNDTIKAAGGNDIIKGEKGNDKIYAGKGNDKIYGGKGNDIINAGTGTNNIYIAKNDGDDIILNGKGSDTIIFSGEKFKNLKAKFSGSDLVIKHSGGKVTLKNYKKVNHSVEFIKGASTKKAITSFFPAAKKYADVPTTSAFAVRAIQATIASWVSPGDDLANIQTAINDPMVNNTPLTTFADNNFNQI